MSSIKKNGTCHTVFTCEWWRTLCFAVIALSLLVLVVFQLQTYFYRFSDQYYNTEVVQLKEEATQAVFLTNGQVYFGDISQFTDTSITLENVYYLQVNQNLQASGDEVAQQANSGISLVKLGTSEIHGPEDTMVISREHVLFWENLQPDSNVVSAIGQSANE